MSDLADFYKWSIEYQSAPIYQISFGYLKNCRKNLYNPLKPNFALKIVGSGSQLIFFQPKLFRMIRNIFNAYAIFPLFLVPCKTTRSSVYIHMWVPQGVSPKTVVLDCGVNGALTSQFDKHFSTHMKRYICIYILHIHRTVCDIMYRSTNNLNS